MTKIELEDWVFKNGTGTIERKYCNGLSWVISPMKDGWFAVFEYNEMTHNYAPRIQASDYAHAESYINRFEEVPVAVNII